MWAFIVVFLYGPGLLGNWLFLLPAVAASVAAVASMRLARSPDGPDSEVLAPGALKASTVDRPRRSPRKVVGRRLRAARPPPACCALPANGSRSSPTVATPRSTCPSTRCGWPRSRASGDPQIDLDIGGTTHTIRIYPLWDLAATVVGPVVAGEWYSQLRAMGAK